MIRNFVLTAGLLATVSLFAAQITPEQASSVALRFMASHVTQQESTFHDPFMIKEIFPVSRNESTLYYLINLDPSGWIAIAADEAIFPILAYSFTGSLDPGNLIPPFVAWMKQYEDQIRYAKAQQADPLPITRQIWEQYLDVKSNTQYPESHPASSIQHPASSIQHPASSIQYPASSIQHPASSIQHPVSSIQYPASSIQYPASSIQYPASLPYRFFISKTVA